MTENTFTEISHNEGEILTTDIGHTQTVILTWKKMMRDTTIIYRMETAILLTQIMCWICGIKGHISKECANLIITKI